MAHVESGGVGGVGKRELEAVHETSQAHLHKQNTQRHSRALTAARSKRNQLEMVASDIDLWVFDESFGVEFFRSFPPFRVPLNGVDVQE